MSLSIGQDFVHGLPRIGEMTSDELQSTVRRIAPNIGNDIMLASLLYAVHSFRHVSYATDVEECRRTATAFANQFGLLMKERLKQIRINHASDGDLRNLMFGEQQPSDDRDGQ